MVTKRTPTIDSGGKLLEKFIPTRLGDTALSATILDQVESAATDSAGVLQDVFTTRQLSSFGDALAVPKIPFASTQFLDASAPGTTDKVAHSLTTVVRGDYSALSGSNPSFGWGVNIFTMTGKTAGDANGANIQNLVETAVATPAGSTLATAIGLMSDCAFFGSVAGAQVGTMTSMRVGAPRRKDGATAGTASTVYGLFVEEVVLANVGATGGMSMLVEGGVSRFGGRVDVTNTIANNGTGDLNIYSGFANADGAVLTLNKTTNGGYAVFKLPSASSEFLINDGTVNTFGITRGGIPKWRAAGNAQTTVGAAGTAAALPSAPVKYLKVQDSAGTTYVIPAYNAA